jgi:PAS domain S-box-containing protein
MNSPETVMMGGYDYGLVVLSILIAVLGSYCTMELAGRVTAGHGSDRVSWLAGGAIAMGIGTWSMHYAGMLAFHLPIPIQYDWPTALLSFLASVFASAVGLFVVSRRKLGFVWILAGSIFMAGGIAALHYTAMASMRLQALSYYSPALVSLSVVLGELISLMSLWLMFLFKEAAIGPSWRKIVSALLLGAAIPVMHYTGMASCSFAFCAALPDLSHAVSVSTLGILGIAIVNVMVVTVVLLTSLADRAQQQKALLDELFEQAPQAVALMDMDHRIVRVNREFTRIFGYSSQETIGRHISELIGAGQSPEDEQKYADRIAEGQPADGECVHQRQDRTTLDVAMVRVPVSLPNGQVAVYGIYRDITEQKQAEAALRQANDQLHLLSRRLFQVQEDERRHLARELHDQIGQALTAAIINLQDAQRVKERDLMVQQLDQSLSILERLLQQVRQLSLDLRPPLLDDLGLVPALQWYVDQQTQRVGLRVDFFADRALERLSGPIETACFRVAQEALTNVVRHARAQTVSVELHREPEFLHLIVRDDGIGFDVAVALDRAQRGASLGLVGMRERVSLVGGELEWRSTPRRGTEVHAFFPIPPRANSHDPT